MTAGEGEEEEEAAQRGARAECNIVVFFWQPHLLAARLSLRRGEQCTWRCELKRRAFVRENYPKPPPLSSAPPSSVNHWQLFCPPFSQVIPRSFRILSVRSVTVHHPFGIISSLCLTRPESQTWPLPSNGLKVFGHLRWQQPAHACLIDCARAYMRIMRADMCAHAYVKFVSLL